MASGRITPSAAGPALPTRTPERDGAALSPRGALLLLGAAALIEAVLLRLTQLMSLPEFFPGPVRISLDFAKMLGPDWKWNTALQFEAFALMFLAFGVALWYLRERRASRLAPALVFVPPLVWSATTAFMYPPYAVDLFHNLADSRLLWIYHLNPMVVPPIARPFAIATSYQDVPSAYGPIWYVLTFPASIFARDDYLRGAVILKLWMDVFYVATGVLVFLIVRRIFARRALFATMLYLWNPFVIMRNLGDGHNDVVMLFFVLIAFYALLTRKWMAVFPALTLSVLIKYVSLILGPLVLFYVLMLPSADRRRPTLLLIAGGGIGVLVAALAYLPFWAGPVTLSALRDEGRLSITSTPLTVQLFLLDHLLGTEAADVSRLLMRVLFLLPYCWLLSRVRPPIERLHGAAYQAFWLFIFIAVAWFRPWYFLWIVTLGALLPSGWFLAATLTLSWFGMFPDIVEQYRNFVPWLTEDMDRLYLAPVLTAFAAPALLWVAGILRTRSWFFDLKKIERDTLPAASAGD